MQRAWHQAGNAAVITTPRLCQRERSRAPALPSPLSQKRPETNPASADADPAQNPGALPQHDTENRAPGSVLFRPLPKWDGNNPASNWQSLFLPMFFVPAQLGGSGPGTPQVNRKDIQALPTASSLHPLCNSSPPPPTLPAVMLGPAVETALWVDCTLGPSPRLHLGSTWTGLTG